MKNLITAVTFSLLPLTSVDARCPANDMGCTKDNYEQKIKDRIKQGKKDV